MDKKKKEIRLYQNQDWVLSSIVKLAKENKDTRFVFDHCRIVHDLEALRAEEAPNVEITNSTITRKVGEKHDV